MKADTLYRAERRPCTASAVVFLAVLWSLFALAVLLPSAASAAVDCSVTPDDPSCVSPSPSPAPSPAATETVTVTATPDPAPAAPGQATGVYVDPSTGSLTVDENTGVALGVAAWLAAVVAGLATAWMVLP